MEGYMSSQVLEEEYQRWKKEPDPLSLAVCIIDADFTMEDLANLFAWKGFSFPKDFNIELVATVIAKECCLDKVKLNDFVICVGSIAKTESDEELVNTIKIVLAKSLSLAIFVIEAFWVVDETVNDGAKGRMTQTLIDYLRELVVNSITEPSIWQSLQGSHHMDYLIRYKDQVLNRCQAPTIKTVLDCAYLRARACSHFTDHSLESFSNLISQAMNDCLKLLVAEPDFKASKVPLVGQAIMMLRREDLNAVEREKHFRYLLFITHILASTLTKSAEVQHRILLTRAFSSLLRYRSKKCEIRENSEIILQLVELVHLNKTVLSTLANSVLLDSIIALEYIACNMMNLDSSSHSEKVKSVSSVRTALVRSSVHTAKYQALVEFLALGDLSLALVEDQPFSRKLSEDKVISSITIINLVDEMKEKVSNFNPDTLYPLANACSAKLKELLEFYSFFSTDDPETKELLENLQPLVSLIKTCLFFLTQRLVFSTSFKHFFDIECNLQKSLGIVLTLLPVKMVRNIYAAYHEYLISLCLKNRHRIGDLKVDLLIIQTFLLETVEGQLINSDLNEEELIHVVELLHKTNLSIDNIYEDRVIGQDSLRLAQLCKTVTNEIYHLQQDVRASFDCTIEGAVFSTYS